MQGFVTSKKVTARNSHSVAIAGMSWQNQPPVVRQVLRGPALQPKLTISAPDDAYEREADRVADRVMRMSDAEVQTTPASPALQRLCPECEEELRTKPESGGTDPAAPVPPIVHDVLRSPGRPLDAASRAFFRPRFGRSFDDVQVHTDVKAAASARAVSALGYTVGKNMVFGTGQYAPHTHSGRSLIAHELTHVLQQGQPKQLTSASSFLAVPAPAQSLQRARCKGDEDPNSIISAHTVTPATIEKPGDSVRIDARFNCEVRSGTRLSRRRTEPRWTSKCQRRKSPIASPEPGMARNSSRT